MRLEQVKRVSLRGAMHAPGHSAVSWQKRLSRIVRHPRHNEVLEFMRNRVRPSLDKVAAEFCEQGLESEVSEDDQARLWISVNHGDEQDFFYSVHARPYVPPSFVMRDTTSRRGEKLRYYRAEVYLKEGGQDYDIMGWTDEQIIADVIDQYERHMHFLHTLR